MTGSAQLDFLVEDEAALAAEERQASELKQQVAERLQLHRQRRGRQETVAADSAAPAKKAGGAKEKIAAAVAERYAHTPSYRTVLAEEARRATERAAAMAEVARRNAEAVAAEQQRLLSELELWDAPQEFSAETAVSIVPEPLQVVEAAPSLTVRLYEDLGRAPAVAQRSNAVRQASVPDAAEVEALDAEIAFRQAPVFEHYSNEPPVPLPANLLEFPRQLVAPRKARPLLAEGPLLEEAKSRSKQLRIFEVEAELISSTPPPVTNAPEWSSIRLDAHTVTAVEERADAPRLDVLALALPPQTAPLELRAMAALVDGALVFGGLLAFAAIFAKVAGQVPAGVPAAIAAGSTFVVFYVLYHLLFFSLSDQTPGMRYARIGLCTFADENPTRKQMRRRILAQAVAVCPLGLGVLWALLDDDGLGWHDRISRMYQRAY
jgi:uncharacterized RDD family membrane protein YckC